jgi:hypothetical protein
MRIGKPIPTMMSSRSSVFFSGPSTSSNIMRE